jgi:hypothetical protein
LVSGIGDENGSSERQNLVEHAGRRTTRHSVIKILERIELLLQIFALDVQLFDVLDTGVELFLFLLKLELESVYRSLVVEHRRDGERVCDNQGNDDHEPNTKDLRKYKHFITPSFMKLKIAS